jgi:hypothetical protein
MGYALSHSRKQRIHIESSMFSSALTDWTVVITDSMVPELAEAGGLLDSAGPALSDGRDIRIAADIDGENGLPLDLRGFLQDADPANGRIEFATKIPLTDPVAGNDIYLFYGDDDATTLLPTDPLGQYEVYDDDTIFYAPVGGGANRTAFNITGTDVGGHYRRGHCSAERSSWDPTYGRRRLLDIRGQPQSGPGQHGLDGFFSVSCDHFRCGTVYLRKIQPYHAKPWLSLYILRGVSTSI